MKSKDDLGYTKFLASVLYELDDFDFEKQFYTFVQNPRNADVSEEEKEAYEVCFDVNAVVFDLILKSRKPEYIA